MSAATGSTARWITWAGVGLLVVGAFVIRARSAKPGPEPTADAASAPVEQPRPHFIELGSDRCKSCKAMIPVMAALRAQYPHSLKVSFIDVWDDPDQGKAYNVTTIPTQILFDPNGNELERHLGFWPAETIVARLASHGYPLTPSAKPADPATPATPATPANGH
jgi:thioredoxin 1